MKKIILTGSIAVSIIGLIGCNSNSTPADSMPAADSIATIKGDILTVDSNITQLPSGYTLIKSLIDSEIQIDYTSNNENYDVSILKGEVISSLPTSSIDYTSVSGLILDLTTLTIELNGDEVIQKASEDAEIEIAYNSNNDNYILSVIKGLVALN